MLSPQALVRGIVQRALPSPNQDSANNDVGLRLATYGEQFTLPIVRKAHGLADEGSYFVTNNAQTGLASTYTAAFTNTSPFIIIQNGNSASRVYLDYISLCVSTAGAFSSTGAYTAVALVIDNIVRYSSAGTNLTANIVSPNMASQVSNPGISVYAGALVATAPSSSARTVIGQRIIRPALSTTVMNVVGDTNLLNFGGVENLGSGQISITSAVMNVMPQSFPPVILGPGQTALLYIFWPAATTPSAAAWLPEVGFWVR